MGSRRETLYPTGHLVIDLALHEPVVSAGRELPAWRAFNPRNWPSPHVAAGAGVDRAA
jgi:hypothetical protein